LYLQLQKYQQFSAHNIDLTMANVQLITANAALMTASAVPITGNIAFMTNAMAASVASFANASEVNSTATQVRLETGRRLLSQQADVEVTPQQLMHADLKERQLLYSMSRKILQNVENVTGGFNVENVNNLLHGLASTDWETKLGKRFDRTMADAEAASDFLALSMEAISAVALARGVNLTSVSNALFGSSKASASPNVVRSTCES